MVRGAVVIDAVKPVGVADGHLRKVGSCGPENKKTDLKTILCDCAWY